MRKIYTHTDGILAMKKERQDTAAKAGVVLLHFGDECPADGILLCDARPRDFKGCRNPDDPADTGILLGSLPMFGGKVLGQFKDFGRALKRAQNLAATL